MISLTQKTRRLGLSMAVAALFATAPAAQAALLDGAVPSEGAAVVNATVAVKGHGIAPVQATAAKGSPDGSTQQGGIATVRLISAVAASVPVPAVLLFATPALLGLVGVARRKHAAGLAG